MPTCVNTTRGTLRQLNRQGLIQQLKNKKANNSGIDHVSEPSVDGLKPSPCLPVPGLNHNHNRSVLTGLLL